MNAEQIIIEAKSITENKISQNALEMVSLKIIDSLITKFGKPIVANCAQSEEDSEVNNVLTHLVEVGSIKYMKDVNIISGNEQALVDKSYATVFLMNLAVGKVLRLKGLLKTNNDGYYGGDGISKIADRVLGLCKLHLNFESLPEDIKNDTFTIDELFSFYLGEYYQ